VHAQLYGDRAGGCQDSDFRRSKGYTIRTIKAENCEAGLLTLCGKVYAGSSFSMLRWTC
jgi:hypothetical protein